MTAPTGTATLNKSTYAPGETMTLTVAYADADTRAITGTVTLTDSSGASSVVRLTGQVSDPVTVAVSDPDRTWTRVSDDGAKAVYSAKA